MGEIDWSKAPEWATKHGYAGPSYIEVWLNDCKYTYCDGRQGGRSFDFCDGWPSRSKKEITSITERPSPAWSGEGLPPVGTFVNHVSCGNEKCRVFAVDGEYVAIASEYTRLWCRASQVYPIRTPEQIAAEEREKACEEMRKIFMEGAADFSGGIAALYDAGYRKQEAS